jgi:hypothetical protein
MPMERLGCRPSLADASFFMLPTMLERVVLHAGLESGWLSSSIPATVVSISVSQPAQHRQVSHTGNTRDTKYLTGSLV